MDKERGGMGILSMVVIISLWKFGWVNINFSNFRGGKYTFIKELWQTKYSYHIVERITKK